MENKLLHAMSILFKKVNKDAISIVTHLHRHMHLDKC
jgi:hypothetical protein